MQEHHCDHCMTRMCSNEANLHQVQIQLPHLCQTSSKMMPGFVNFVSFSSQGSSGLIFPAQFDVCMLSSVF